MMPLISPDFDHSEIEMLAACLESGWVTQGPFVSRFEDLVRKEQEVEHALATTSCTAGLHLANMALGIGPGDEVIVPAFTWVTSAYSVEYVGATPVFADIDLDTFNLSINSIEDHITHRTRAIMPVHLFGLPCDMDPLLAIARKHDLLVIEDAACGIGTKYKGKPVGGFGDAGAFSFHPRKIITTGEGGMVTTQSDEVAAEVRSLRNHGATGPPAGVSASSPHVMSTFRKLGFNLRLSDIQAAVGVSQMAKLGHLIAHRRSIANLYAEALQGVSNLILPVVPDYAFHTFQSFVVRLVGDSVSRRNEVMQQMYLEGISTRPGTHSVPLLDYFVKAETREFEKWPNAILAEKSTITLPIFPDMSITDVEKVVKSLRRNICN